MRLTEGLRPGDLNHMVLPLISVDEFNSKIDDRTVIVVAFYSFEEDPAHDLSNFIERSPENVLDTDVSPAPTREGYYVTFVEIKRDSKFVSKLLKILDEVNNLTQVKQWQFTSQKLPAGKVLPVTQANLEKWVNVQAKPDKSEKPTAEQIKEWFSHSALHNVHVQDDHIMLERAGVQHVYEVVSMQSDLPDLPHMFTEHAVSVCNRLERLLDHGYQVHQMADHVVIQHPVHETYLVLNQNT
jgi:hypothetical protein